MCIYVGNPGKYCSNMQFDEYGYTDCKLTNKQCVANRYSSSSESYNNDKSIVTRCPSARCN